MQRWLCILLIGVAPVIALTTQAQDTPPKRLLIAFSSYRDRPKHAQIHFYEHDGVAQGKIIGNIPTINNRQDYHPILSKNGKLCVFASELENETSKIFLFDMADKKLITPAKLNTSPNAQLHPTMNAEGTLIVYAAWDKPGSSQRWDLQAWDVPGQKFIELPGINSPKFDERMPALSGDGRWLAFVSNHKDNIGGADIYLYDRTSGKVIAIPELNSPLTDITPSMNADGNLIAFASDRADGKGGRDIYLYDRAKKSFLPLAGVNSIANEQTPSLSADGRFLAFVSERIKGEGERDVFLYDRQTQKLLPTPGLNSKRDDIDPCVIVLD